MHAAASSNHSARHFASPEWRASLAAALLLHVMMLGALPGPKVWQPTQAPPERVLRVELEPPKESDEPIEPAPPEIHATAVPTPAPPDSVAPRVPFVDSTLSEPSAHRAAAPTETAPPFPVREAEVPQAVEPPKSSATPASPLTAVETHISLAIGTAKSAPGKPANNATGDIGTNAASATVSQGVALQSLGGAPALGERARPNYRKNPAPEYPASARRRNQEGLVLLTVLVTPEGKAAGVSVRTSSGFKALDEAALKAVRGWEFEPARVDGVAVASEIEVPVRFQMNAPGSTP